MLAHHPLPGVTLLSLLAQPPPLGWPASTSSCCCCLYGWCCACHDPIRACTRQNYQRRRHSHPKPPQSAHPSPCCCCPAAARPQQQALTVPCSCPVACWTATTCQTTLTAHWPASECGLLCGCCLGAAVCLSGPAHLGMRLWCLTSQTSRDTVRCCWGWLGAVWVLLGWLGAVGAAVSGPAHLGLGLWC